jgi:hypothetical protein
MLHYTLWNKGLDDLEKTFSSVEEAIYAVIKADSIYNELISLLQYQYDQIEFVDKHLDLDFQCPLDLYCRYTLDQLLVALGRHTERKRKHFQEGVLSPLIKFALPAYFRYSITMYYYLLFQWILARMPLLYSDQVNHPYT